MQQVAQQVTQLVLQVADMEEDFYGKWEELCETLRLIKKE